MTMMAIAFLAGVVVGGVGMWLIAIQPFDDPNQVSEDWIRGHLYDDGKTGY